MPSAVALRHLAFEDLGTFEDVLKSRGFDVTYVQPGDPGLDALDLMAPDLVVSLGGPISARATADYPWLVTEIDKLKARLDADRPSVGICLGAQLMAKALGAVIESAPEPEIGYSLLFLTEAGRNTPLKHFADEVFVLHWHGENFDLPDGAEWLAYTELCPYQAFRFGKNALGLQFHPEARSDRLEHWLIGHAHEISHSHAARPKQLRLDAARWGAALEQHGKAFFNDWLDSVGL